jgi:DNA-binding winged helix-turn-helix (wHTH) protein/tetratricopeptide (TPR) repeat protein
MASYRFEEFELIPDTRRLLHSGADVAIGIRVLEVVIYLVENRARAVGRDELLSAVWGRADGGDATLAQAVLKARRALGDDGNAQNFIRTVARFGYQWVAATTELSAVEARGAAPLPVRNDDDVDSTPQPRAEAERATTQQPVELHRSRRPFVIGAFAALALVAVAIGFSLVGISSKKSLPADRSAHTVAGAVPGLILVTPTRVHSMSADDGWMRLGVMSLAAQALAGVPGHAVVPDETTLAAVAHAGADAGAEALRAATGASVVIVSEANRVGEDWRLDATVLNNDGSAQIVSARAGDPIAAASSLARNLRGLLAPEGTGDAAETMMPGVLALAAHMKSAILEAQNGRALALLAEAPKNVAAAPEIVLLQAEALTQLGKPAESIDVLRPLVDAAAVTSPPPRWLPGAWSALGDTELARGNPAQAEAYFRRAIQLDGVADRRTLGLAWRGLGIAQVVRNDLDGAEQSYLRARLELEPVGDRLLLARVTDGLGYIATTRGRMADALMMYEQAADMGAAAGLNETELGSRLNIAQAHHYLLHHALALDKLRALLPRIQAVDYPALHTFGSIAYANALIETGAFAEARAELARLHDASSPDAATDAVVDVRLDEAQIRLALGDAPAAVLLADAVRRDHDTANAPDLHLEALAVLLNAYAAAGDRKSAAALVADADAWTPENAGPPARVHALVAQARWAAASGDAAAALDDYRQALVIAREFGTPLVLRDAAVPYAKFQLDAGAIDLARATASTVGPYAEDDFEIALLMARVAAATHDADLARSYFAQARRLAGERWTRSLADEEARLAGTPARDPASRAVAGG